MQPQPIIFCGAGMEKSSNMPQQRFLTTQDEEENTNTYKYAYSYRAISPLICLLTWRKMLLFTRKRVSTFLLLSTHVSPAADSRERGNTKGSSLSLD
jgi:hypothetical protein